MKDFPSIKTKFPLTILEIGYFKVYSYFRIGSGFVLQNIAKKLGEQDTLYFGIDLNPTALRHVSLNNENFHLILGSFESFCRTEPLFDFIFCNPPYVPSEPLNILKADGISNIDLALLGGLNGREVIDKIIVLSKVSCILST